MELTCNQLIVLLEIYRGSFDPFDAHHMGTIDNDVTRLHRLKYIQTPQETGSSETRWKITEKARKEIEKILSETKDSSQEIESQTKNNKMSFLLNL